MTAETSRFNLCELFVSVQGEGTYLGQPSIFIRSSGCNLRCKWENTLCDTEYASWEPEENVRSVDEILSNVRSIQKQHPNITHVVVTGGEPTLQPGLSALIHGLHAQELFITLETNGSIKPESKLPIDLVSISPKLESSTPWQTEFEDMHCRGRLKLDVLKHWTDNYVFQFKFVILGEDDEAEIHSILDAIGNVDPGQVFLMPEGVSTEELREHGKSCITIALRNGWRYTPRAHIVIFGNKRGT